MSIATTRTASAFAALRDGDHQAIQFDSHGEGVEALALEGVVSILDLVHLCLLGFGRAADGSQEAAVTR